MPVYVYQCNDCSNQYSEELLNSISDEEYGEKVLFETYHSIEASEEELKTAVVCPRCDSHDCHKSFVGVNIRGRIKGYGWKDYTGARRDMNMFKLTQEDPYAGHRVPGEVDELATNMSKQGKYNPNSKHFPVKSADSAS